VLGRFADLSLKRKLVLITMIIVLAATATTLVFLQHEAARSRNEQFVQRALAQTRLVAEYVVGPLVFEDNKGAHELLAKLLLDPNVAYARLEDALGTPFAEAASDGATAPSSPSVTPASGAASTPPAGTSDAAWHIDDEVLHVVVPVQQKGMLGQLWVGYRLSELKRAVVAERNLLLLVTLGVIAASYLLAMLLQRVITTPLLRLARHTRNLAETNELETLPPPGKDEVGGLYVAFNHLIERVRQREEEILAFNRSLEAKVADRTQALEDARNRADRASRSKSEFLANMSHEIRTPINAITGFTALARRTELDARQSGYLETIDTAAHNLLRIVDDLLDFSKIEAGRLDLERIPFRLADVMNTVVAFVGPLAEKKGLELLLHVSPDVPSHWIGDPLRLGQVLMNLCSNAVKFTQRGEVEVRVSLAHVIEDVARLRFAVRDTGIGLTPEQSGKLFQAFAQADTSTTRRFGGTGLGLVICERLVALMDGRIWFDSTPGAGTTFQFEVELGLGAEADAELRGALPETLRGMPALVVDDNANARHILVEQLSALGMDARAVQSGEAALEELRRATSAGHPYPVVLMDWRMPGVDGVAATRSIRADASIAGTPVVIMVTAFGREQPLATAESMNLLDGVLLKPVTPALMLEALRQAIHRGQGAAAGSAGDGPAAAASTREARREARALIPPSKPARIAQLAGIRVLLVEDHQVNQQLAKELLEQDGAQVTIAGHGLAALDAIDRAGLDHFDIALVDLQMPEMDGLEFTRRIRERADGAALPIVAMTAHAMVEERERCLAAGMNDHLAKPIEPEAVIRTVRRWVGAKTLNEAAQRTGNAAAPAMESAPQPADAAAGDLRALTTIDTEAALRRCAGNEKLLRTLLREFRRHHAESLAELARARESGNRAAAKALLHTLKGSAGNIGAREVAAAAAALEPLFERAAAAGDAATGNTSGTTAEIDAGIGVLAQALNKLNAELDAELDAPGSQHDRTLTAAAGTPSATQPAEAAGSGAAAAVQAVLHALARRLSENDTRAEETLADLRHALAGSEPPWLSAASAAIERLDYASALAALPPHEEGLSGAGN